MNKEKKLKLILSSFKQKQLLKFFETFLDTIKCKFYKSIKQISFSCYESTCQVENYMVNGYGKTSSQALISGINNIIDCLVQDQEYCEVMRQCLKKFNISPYGLTNNGSTSKKQLLTTEKTVKTLGAQTSMSLQKKVLTMSANLSSNSKNSSSKPKSIKEEIFEYFNLQNLKVKNPNQPFSSVSPIGANNKIPKFSENTQTKNLCKSKQKYPLNQVEPNTSFSYAEKQLQQIYKRIKEVKQKISCAQKQNFELKKQIQSKKRTSLKTSEALTNQFFTRPSLDGKQQRKVNLSTNTQSSKKISYLEMSLNDKLLIKSQKEQKNAKYEVTNENHFQKVEIPNNFKASAKTNQNQKLIKSNVQDQNGHGKQQRKCLVDISNIKTEVSQLQAGNKSNQYATFNGTSKKTFQAKQSQSAFQTANQINERLSSNGILYSKASQQESMSIIQSSKKLRSFSVQNSLNEKVGCYGTSQKNPISILSGVNMNASFDHGNISGPSAIPQKKITIPKLNLQILPNYHGRSNKSLNQSLMQNYQKKNHLTNPINQ